MRYVKLDKFNMVNGDGIRVVLWLTGCDHNCKGCYNQALTHDSSRGILYTEETEEEILNALNHDYVAGLTFTGGDPLHDANLDGVRKLMNKVRQVLPEKDIWMYSGYVLDEALDDPDRVDIVLGLDVLVDGRFEEENISPNKKWVGSSNQRVIRIGR